MFEGHIVILGWHQGHTARMINLIYGDSRRVARKVVLCAMEEMDNPFPEQVYFVRGESLHSDTWRRSGFTVMIFSGAVVRNDSSQPGQAPRVSGYDDSH